MLYFQVKCGNCGEVSQKETYVALGETVPIPKSRGTAHLVQKVVSLSGLSVFSVLIFILIGMAAKKIMLLFHPMTHM